MSQLDQNVLNQFKASREKVAGRGAAFVRGGKRMRSAAKNLAEDVTQVMKTKISPPPTAPRKPKTGFGAPARIKNNKKAFSGEAKRSEDAAAKTQAKAEEKADKMKTRGENYLKKEKNKASLSEYMSDLGGAAAPGKLGFGERVKRIISGGATSETGDAVKRAKSWRAQAQADGSYTKGGDADEALSMARKANFRENAAVWGGRALPVLALGGAAGGGYTAGRVQQKKRDQMR
jgi:hypothetical protein